MIDVDKFIVLKEVLWASKVLNSISDVRAQLNHLAYFFSSVLVKGLVSYVSVSDIVQVLREVDFVLSDCSFVEVATSLVYDCSKSVRLCIKLRVLEEHLVWQF